MYTHRRTVRVQKSRGLRPEPGTTKIIRWHHVHDGQNQMKTAHRQLAAFILAVCEIAFCCMPLLQHAWHAGHFLCSSTPRPQCRPQSSASPSAVIDRGLDHGLPPSDCTGTGSRPGWTRRLSLVDPGSTRSRRSIHDRFGMDPDPPGSTHAHQASTRVDPQSAVDSDRPGTNPGRPEIEPESIRIDPYSMRIDSESIRC